MLAKREMLCTKGGLQTGTSNLNSLFKSTSFFLKGLNPEEKATGYFVGRHEEVPVEPNKITNILSGRDKAEKAGDSIAQWLGIHLGGGRP